MMNVISTEEEEENVSLLNKLPVLEKEEENEQIEIIELKEKDMKEELKDFVKSEL